jgi:hypothetical protein
MLKYSGLIEREILRLKGIVLEYFIKDWFIDRYKNIDSSFDKEIRA